MKMLWFALIYFVLHILTQSNSTPKGRAVNFNLTPYQPGNNYKKPFICPKEKSLS